MRTTLHAAAVQGQVEEVMRLLAEGANPNAVDEVLDTPLHLAADAAHVETVNILLKAGADPNAVCEDGDTPLHRGVPNAEITETLLQAGAQMMPDGTGGTPLHFAANLNCDSAIPILLHSGAEIDRQDIDGNTPLHDATRMGNIPAALVLIRNGANHLIENDRQLTPLELGHESGHYDLVHLAMREIETPMHHAAYRGDQSGVQFLVQEKVDPNARDDRGFTPLFYAVMAGHLRTAEFLADNGANVHIVARFGANALEAALWSHHIGVLEYLLAKGVSPNTGDEIRGGNALHNAVRRGFAAAIPLLVVHGAEINATDFWGRTPLDQARDYGQVAYTAEQEKEIVQALISVGGRYTPPMSEQQRLNELQWLAAMTDRLAMLAPYRTIAG